MVNAIYFWELPQKTKREISDFAVKFVINYVREAFNALDPKFDYSEKGKPFFKDYPNFHFNISHSAGYLAVAVSKLPVGVDVEEIRAVNPDISRSFFTEDERNYTKNSADLLYVWTRKEALLKQSGEGISKNMSKIDALNNKAIKTYKTDKYILSVCSEYAEDFEIIYKENFCGNLKTRD